MLVWYGIVVVFIGIITLFSVEPYQLDHFSPPGCDKIRRKCAVSTHRKNVTSLYLLEDVAKARGFLGYD